ncbi:MAG: hypothetical protein JWR21_3298 [Herminiimonas sp.]|nr:hypothetical protein [Herminiimonas sp.]
MPSEAKPRPDRFCVHSSRFEPAAGASEPILQRISHEACVDAVLYCRELFGHAARRWHGSHPASPRLAVDPQPAGLVDGLLVRSQGGSSGALRLAPSMPVFLRLQQARRPQNAIRIAARVIRIRRSRWSPIAVKRKSLTFCVQYDFILAVLATPNPAPMTVKVAQSSSIPRSSRRSRPKMQVALGTAPLRTSQ